MSLRVVVLVLCGCAGAAARPAPVVTISVVGTTDLHGHISALPLFGGYLANLRAARAADGGGVVLVDGGDMFQGTLESDANAGAPVVAAFGALGYDAVAVGNHDFDYGREALVARAAEAKYPFLSANIVDTASGKTLVAPSVTREVAGVKVGIIGVVTIDTPRSSLPRNFKGLEARPLAAAIDDAARAVRAGGAEVVIVTAHAGLCVHTADAEEVKTCDDGEILDVVRALKEPVDVVAAGHTHVGAVKREGRTAIVQAWKFGRGFSRVDVRFDTARRQIVDKEVHLPLTMTEGATYEGAPVVPDGRVTAVIAPYLEAAARRRKESLGVRLETRLENGYDRESPLGNLIADLMRAARPREIAIGNGGALRRPLDAGELTYGAFFEAFPFDNTFATGKISGETLRKVLVENLQDPKGILTISGVRLEAACRAGTLEARLLRPDGREVGPAERLTVTTSEYLAAGFVPIEELSVEDRGSIRDEAAALLKARGGVLRGDDPALAARRLVYPGKRPVVCK